MEFIKQIEETEKSTEQVIDNFITKINTKKISKEEFIFNNQKWFIDYHPYDHSDDIIISESIINKYDNFLLVKTGASRTRIPGWCSKEQLLSTPKRDIYRNNKFYYMVVDSNLQNLQFFKIKETRALKEKFIINKQIAENLGHKEMISGILAGLHNFCKQTDVYFKDINQKDECFLGNKKVKIYTRDIMSDEDMMIYESYYKKHPEIDLYICCKMKAGEYWYVGYITKEIVADTRIVQMIGNDSEKESSEIRRIFAEQYKPISDLIKIYEKEKQEEQIVQQNYVPLHVHSEFSIGDGFGTCKYIAESLYKKGFKACAITDHGTLAGVWEFQKALLERGIKPIIGCELYIQIPESEKRMHQTVLVKNEIGYKNLLKLHEIAVREDFYYKPIVKIENLFKYSEGLIILSGCIDSAISNLLKENKEDVAEKYIARYKETWKDDFYGELQLHTCINNQNIMKKSYALYQKYNIKSVITTDAHYSYQSDKKYHEAVKAIGLRKKYGEAGFGDNCFYLMTDEDINQRILTNKENNWFGLIIEKLKNNTYNVLSKINFEIKTANNQETLPRLFSSKEEARIKLKEMCVTGLEKYTPYKYEGVAKEKLDLEMSRFFEKGYENYFLIVEDMIRWAKQQGIMVGPGRGSVGASLAAYALNITECDPIKFNLLFDRFISEIRRDAPDVDMDYQDNRRQEVVQYLINKYGIYNSAKVATYSRFHPKGILRDVGRIFSISISEIEKICNLVLIRSGGDARASFGLLDTFAEFEEAKAFKLKYPSAVDVAIKLEGHIRHKGVHAAALVLTDKPISEYLPLNKIGGEIVTEWEKQLVEDAGLTKFDILGLKTLTVISECMKMVPQKLPSDFEDPEVYKKVFSNGKSLGIFQFETVGLSKLIKELKTDNFSTLYDATTLFRPGALHSGQTMLYVNRHLGKAETNYEHPLLKELTKDTKGIILYQEQIMQIMNRIGGMSWATAEMARKVITKSKGKKAFEEMRAEFVRNANKLHNMPKKDAEKLYDVVSTFGSYSFNKAHAVEYSIISYWCAWLKTYYPFEFYKAILKFENKSEQISNYLNDALDNGVKVEYPNINYSEFSYSAKQKAIYSGFNSINGIGKKTAEKIIKLQPFVNFEDFTKRCNIGASTIKSLVIADCFRDFGINKRACYERDIKEIRNCYTKEIADYSDIEYAELIMENTSLRPKINILKSLNFGDFDFINIENLGESNGGKQGYVRGVVTAIINKDKLIRPMDKKHIHNFEPHMIYLNINDGTGNLAIQISPHTYDKYKELIYSFDKKPVVVYGTFNKVGQKMYGELLQIPDKMHDVDEFKKNLNSGETIIISSTPAVSKNEKSYYRIKLSNGIEGLCFRSLVKLYPGIKVKYRMNKEPFMDIEIIK